MSASTSQALDYLEQLPGATHKKLYQQPSTTLAIFRCMLPHLAKSIVMAMLYMTGPFPVSDLDSWIKPEARGEKEKALSVLSRLHIVSFIQDQPRLSAYRLTSGFASSLRQALTGGGNHNSFGVPSSDPDEDGVDVAFLDRHAQDRWESILYYMVGSTSGLSNAQALGSGVETGTKQLLEAGGFVTMSHGRVKITREGFSFVLQETNAQVWSLLVVYLKYAPERLGMSENDMLSFLFMLGSLDLGTDYSTTNLTATQSQMLEDLNDFGIIYRSSRTSPRFYPTRLATTLTSDSGASSETFSNALRPSSSSKGYIIIETNYRLYAYTSSLLQIAVLSLFTKFISRHPNLVSGKLSKESVLRAIDLGISATQIIDYLTAHAHPQMQKSNPVLPPTVMDQIRLWEYEGERVETTDGYLMKDFGSDAEYRELVDYAESLGVLVWKSDTKRLLFVDRIDQIKLYLMNKRR